MQLAFRTMLSSLHPPLSGESKWDDVRGAVSLDTRMAELPEERREAIFEELRTEAESHEAMQRQQLVETATTAPPADGTAGGAPQLDTEDELEVLSVLRSEQVRSAEPLHEPGSLRNACKTANVPWEEVQSLRVM